MGGISEKIAQVLDFKEYTKLAAPSQNNPVEIYQLKDENLFDQIIMKYAPQDEINICLAD